MVEAAARAGSVWRNPAYVRLWTSETLSRFGEPFAQVGIPIVAVLILAATPMEVGLLNGAAEIAFLVIGLPVGAWMDRRAKRPVMMRATLVRAAALACVPALWWSGGLQIWHLFLIAAVIGGASVFYDVGYQSYVPEVVSAEQVASANAGLETTNQIAQVGGPAVAGAILAVVRAPVLLLITAVGYVASFMALAGGQVEERVHAPAIRQTLRTEIAEGMRFVLGQQLLRRITLMSAAANLFGGIAATVYPIFVLRTLGIPAWAFAVIGGAGAIGGVLGALAAPKLATRLGEGVTIVIGIAIGALPFLVPPLVSRLGEDAGPILAAGQGIEIFGVVVYNICQVSFRQRICPPELLGRMNASVRFLVWGVQPIGAVIGGALGAWFGIVPTLWASAVLTILSVGIVLFSPLRTMRILPTTASL